ncbi:MAG: hypothetical protein WC341_05580 [Bacteroidales bacterium]|jgi:tetratricopeptide (TPR) repeat protein
MQNRTVVFKWIAIGTVILFFLMLEIAARIFMHVDQRESRSIDMGKLSFFSRITVKGEPSVRITNKYGYADQLTTFKERKSPGTFRIFCLGGSACAGWPHPAGERFSAYLDTCLRKIYTGTSIEMINCGAHGFASYRVREVFHQLIPYQPDAIIVWSGNNEFLEDQRFKTSKIQSVIHALAQRVKIVQLIKSALPNTKLNGNEPEVAGSFWKKVQQQSLELCSNPDLFRKVNQGYEQSIEGIIHEAKENGIKVLLLTVPVNLRDWQPNVSRNLLSGNDSLLWSKMYNLGCNNLENNDFKNAQHCFEKAINREPHHAMSYFMLASCFEEMNDSLLALRNYTLAKDLDCNPFRAISGFNEIIRETAVNNPDVNLFDAEATFRRYARKGIPGFDLFLDYVHPTKKGNLILASELAEYIRENDLFKMGKSPTKIDVAMLKTFFPEYSDETDVSLQLTRYSLCCLTHQYKSAIQIGTTILNSLLYGHQENNNNKHEFAKLKDGIQCFSMLLNIEKHRHKGVVNLNEEKLALVARQNFYKAYYPYGTY